MGPVLVVGDDSNKNNNINIHNLELPKNIQDYIQLTIQ
jgi:hypothetical protein